MKTDNDISMGLDRSSFRRVDENWIHEKIFDENSRIIPVYQAKVLCRKRQERAAVFLNHKHFSNFADIVDSAIFLGIYEGKHYFSIELKSEQLASDLSEKTESHFQNLKSIISIMSRRDSELLALARFSTFWHSNNKYCGKCGHLTQSAEAGHVRICENPDCKEFHFPSMDPAVIVLVSSGKRCLLGRNKEWPNKIYSTLAGFVEPGENIEETVVREIHEEAGIHVDQVEYHYSQSWLFPKSLMLGFTARAKNEEIVIAQNELEDARWFTREELIKNPNCLPSKGSIARKLIMEWLGKDEAT